MRHADLVSGQGRLTRAAAELRERWLTAKAEWTDQVSRDFERDHLAHLPPQINAALAAAHHLAELLEQAEKELEDPRRGG